MRKYFAPVSIQTGITYVSDLIFALLSFNFGTFMRWQSYILKSQYTGMNRRLERDVIPRAPIKSEMVKLDEEELIKTDTLWSNYAIIWAKRK